MRFFITYLYMISVLFEDTATAHKIHRSSIKRLFNVITCGKLAYICGKTAINLWKWWGMRGEKLRQK
ncbi:hypothetical protein [Chroogloeocystis siderophila]|uniref:hypothetical protein n=1 Tax=Chroogloeocystis siderophila TaxID=329163 RepID=UPI001161539B|nr:hypothetical protein [Chroogloeocystis siderophila]